ncbi:MAG: HD domain-containing protein [Clostridiales bacterium]|nr:HD domain-containing protein [Clostridiales bacterium]
MTFSELFEETEFAEIYKEISRFSDDMLCEYNKKICLKKNLGNNRKEIFDAVWGNIEFSGGEVYILDSPLLQRLRKIKQLGLAYYVYCGCDYSRFYHTLGVTFLANRMAEAINRCELGIDDKKKNYFRETVRLAAIFHDVGHMFLSHVSEHYFGKSPLYPRSNVIESALVSFEKKAGKETALHELLSCMIVNTNAVHTLLKYVSAGIPEIGAVSDEEINELVEYISCLIVGVPVDRGILPYSSIINGPIDADKCDYLSRDSHATRVPVAVDISRITQKLSVVETNDINMSLLWHDNADVSNKFYELAMVDSAEKALFQLCIARTIMFDSVYYHHKVLTAETGMRNLLNQLSHLNKPLFTTFSEILNYTDEDFNYYFFEAMKADREKADCDKLDCIYNQLVDLYNRNMAKRVVCLMPEYLEGTQSCKENLFDSILTTIDSSEEKTLIQEIKGEYINICKLCNQKVSDIDNIQIYVIQAPTNIFGHSKIQVPIDLRNGIKRDFRGYELVSSRETSSSASYIVSNENDRLLLFLAIEKILYKKYDIRIKKEGIACGKFEQKEVNNRCNSLFKSGYYNDAPLLIRDELLYNHISKSKVSKIKEKYSSYEGPKGYKVTEKEIESFFKQVMSACLDKNMCNIVVEGVYKLLDKALFINREYIANTISETLRTIADGDDILYVVPLGSLMDSGKHMMYFWNDIKDLGFSIETETSLKEIIQDGKTDKIMFFDDGSYSGTQLTSIMQEYLGIKDKKTKEEHVQVLPKNLRDTFCKKELVFFLIAFNKSKEKELKLELSELGLTNISFKYINDMSNKCLEEQTNLAFKNDEQREGVKNLLKNVGFELMNSTKKVDEKYKDGWSEERVKNAALGYNDSQQMVFLKSSVPTYTITAFWKEGIYNGFKWNPLFRRTDK